MDIDKRTPNRGQERGISKHKIETLARLLLAEIKAFFKSEEGQKGLVECTAGDIETG